MPKPIPPPPPQASPEETVRAVRLARGLLACAILMFLGLAATYGPDSWLVQVGRNNSSSWALYKLDQLDEDQARAHEGGRVAWLVGSSLVRAAFDEEALNARLEELDAPLRGRKFAMDRGAAGHVIGLLRRLPVAQGDVVVHAVSAEHYRPDWLEFTGLPAWRLRMVLEPSDLWAIQEWTVQDKLEASMLFPADYWSYQDETMMGYERSLLALLSEGRLPRPRRRSIHLRYATVDRAPGYTGDFPEGDQHPRFQSLKSFRPLPGQINLDGLTEMRAWCEERGAQLILVEVPPSPVLREQLQTSALQRAWGVWTARQGVRRLGSLPEEAYMDEVHPNGQGRALLTEELARLFAVPASTRLER